MSIVFGSPEARAILARDKQLQRDEEEEQPKGDKNTLAERLEQVEFEIENLENELAGLEDEATEIRQKLKELGKPDNKPGLIALRDWNNWATGKGSGITVPEHQQSEMDKWSQRVKSADHL